MKYVTLMKLTNRYLKKFFRNSTENYNLNIES